MMSLQPPGLLPDQAVDLSIHIPNARKRRLYIQLSLVKGFPFCTSKKLCRIQHSAAQVDLRQNIMMNPAYSKPTPAASIGWGGFVSATWGREVNPSEGIIKSVIYNATHRRLCRASPHNTPHGDIKE
jgi:hypothetical protein